MTSQGILARSNHGLPALACQALRDGTCTCTVRMCTYAVHVGLHALYGGALAEFSDGDWGGILQVAAGWSAFIKATVCTIPSPTARTAIKSSRLVLLSYECFFD